MRSGFVKLALITCAGMAGLAACSASGVDNTIPTQLVLFGGNSQIGDAGTTLDTLLSVQVLNISNQGVAGVVVNWEVKTGGGALASATSSSGADGFAKMSFQLGPNSGVQTVQASRTNLLGSPVLFTETARNQGGGGGGPPIP